MILLTVDEILRLHKKLVKTTGGSEELRDISLLESAVYSTEAAYGGVELYPSVPEKAASWHTVWCPITPSWTEINGSGFWRCS